MGLSESRKHICPMCQKTFKRSEHCARHKRTRQSFYHLEKLKLTTKNQTRKKDLSNAALVRSPIADVCNHTVLMDRCSRTRDALQRHEKFNHSGEYSPTIQHHLHMPGPFIPHIDNETDSRFSHSPSVVQLLSESSPKSSPPAQIEQSFARNDHMSVPANTSLSPHYPVDLASAVSIFDQDLQSEASFLSSRSSSKSAVCELFGSSMDSILLYCDTPDSYPSSLLPSPTSLLCSGLEIRPKSPELADISLPLAQMFDPLWDPWKAQQDAVRSYMADVHPVRRES